LKLYLKIICVVFLLVSIVGGLLIPVPRLAILHETIRNLFYHVPMWFAMIAVLIASLYYSIKYLGNSNYKYDILAEESARVGIMFGILGLITGSIWAKYTWGAWWTNDVKLNGAAATMLVYFAYFLLRNSLDDEHKRARIAAVYSIFAFALMLVFIFILPRLTDSLHPGNGGNPAFAKYDLDNNMRLIFYPAVIGWALLAAWMVNIRVRIRKLQNHFQNID
jgi:heme exporter protein C